MKYNNFGNIFIYCQICYILAYIGSANVTGSGLGQGNYAPYDRYCELLAGKAGRQVFKGVFGADMQCALVKEGPDMGLENILAAVRELMKADAAGEKVTMHCSFGNNRSRTVAGAFHFKKMGF